MLHIHDGIFIANLLNSASDLPCRDLSRCGLACQVLNLRLSRSRKLNMVGKFVHMHTLNLDFSASLSGFRENCFSHMPYLRFLSLCGTAITNLWTTTAALTKLPSLVELRFQNCSYCNDVGYSSASSGNEGTQMELSHCIELLPPSDELFSHIQLNIDGEDLDDYDMTPDIGSTSYDSSDDSELDFSGQQQTFHPMEFLPGPIALSELADLENEVLLVSYFNVFLFFIVLCCYVISLPNCLIFSAKYTRWCSCKLIQL